MNKMQLIKRKLLVLEVYWVYVLFNLYIPLHQTFKLNKCLGKLLNLLSLSFTLFLLITYSFIKEMGLILTSKVVGGLHEIMLCTVSGT